MVKFQGVELWVEQDRFEFLQQARLDGINDLQMVGWKTLSFGFLHFAKSHGVGGTRRTVPN